MDSTAVRHDDTRQRYEIDAGNGVMAHADYELDSLRMMFTHTWVPPEARGRGLAENLVRHALEDARRLGRRVVPQCSYVARYIARNTEFQDLVER